MIDTTKKVTGVNVNGTAMTVGDLTTKTITTNGTYNAQTDDGVNGYSEVVVNVSDGSGGSGSTLQDYLDMRGKADYLFFESYYMTDQDLASILSYDDTRSCQRFYMTFGNCQTITTIPLIDTSAASTMEQMFYGCWALTSLPQGFDTGYVNNVSNMFGSCTSLTACPTLSTGSVGNFSGMFSGCTALTDISAVANYNTAAANDMSYMFYGCSNLVNVAGVTFDLSNCSNINYMFGMSGITQDVSFSNTSSLTSAQGLYATCTSLVSATHLTFAPMYASQLFESCTSLTTIGSMDCSNVVDTYNMFYDCTALTSIGIYGILVDFDLSSSELLPASELSTLISNLGDVANQGNPSTYNNYATLTLGATNLAKLSQSDIDAATAKGWTLT